MYKLFYELPLLNITIEDNKSDLFLNIFHYVLENLFLGRFILKIVIVHIKKYFLCVITRDFKRRNKYLVKDDEILTL